MTKLLLLLVAFSVLSAFGSVVGRFRKIPPTWRVWFGLLALLGLFLSTIALLAAILMPEILVLHGVREIWTACTAAFQDIWHHPIHRIAPIVAGTVLAILLGRLVWAIAGSLAATHRARLAQGEPTWRLASGVDVFVVDVKRPEAFSVGGRRGQVIITRGLLDLLDEDERRAVVLHEEGHLKARHHRLLAIGRTTGRALAPFPPAALALDALEQALEEVADDYAASRLGSGLTVASGLSKAALAGIRSPAGALSLGDGPDVPARIRRLLAGTSPNSRWMQLGCVIGLLALLSAIFAAQLVAGLAVVAAVHHLLGLGTVLSCPLFR